MPPNLGGFFMVRSYYPSECHADYFDFERIEALKPAIEACGISTLSQSPMLGRSRHLARKLSLRRKRSSPNVFEMAATETITSIILIKLIRVSLGTVRHPR